MKKLMLVLSLLMFVACSKAADVKFAWDYPAGATVSGFEMRIMDGADAVIQTVDCGKPADNTCLIPAITPGVRKAQCFAYATGIPVTIKEMSIGSNVVNFTVPVKPVTPLSVRLSFP